LRQVNAATIVLPAYAGMKADVPKPPSRVKLALSPSRLTRAAVFAVIIALAAAALWWWFGRGTPVTIARAKIGTAAEIVYATGAVEPETWTRVTPLVRGRIVERCRCEGKTVKAGDRLARLDDREPQATLNDLRAMEEFARREFDRQTQLLARGATTTQAYQKAESDLTRASSQISAQTQRLDYFRIASPMDGVVLREDGEVGDMVDPGTILYKVGLPKPLWIVADVNEEDIPRVALGQTALLRTDAFADQVLRGTVKQMTPAGDPVAKTFRVRIGLPDDTPLQVGMSVEANIVVKEKPGVVLVPANAVTGTSVFVVDGSRARRRAVEIGIRGTHAIEILRGLSAGEAVVAPATSDIRDGLRIRTQAAADWTP
jgi:RND family efflux transporter MFP subunit